MTKDEETEKKLALQRAIRLLSRTCRKAGDCRKCWLRIGTTCGLELSEPADWCKTYEIRG